MPDCTCTPGNPCPEHAQGERVIPPCKATPYDGRLTFIVRPPNHYWPSPDGTYPPLSVPS